MGKYRIKSGKRDVLGEEVCLVEVAAGMLDDNGLYARVMDEVVLAHVNMLAQVCLGLVLRDFHGTLVVHHEQRGIIDRRDAYGVEEVVHPECML